MSFDRPFVGHAETPAVVRETLTSLEAKLFTHRPCGRHAVCHGREMIKACHRTMADPRLRHIALTDSDYMGRFVDALTGRFDDQCGLDCEVANDALGALQDVICALETLAELPAELPAARPLSDAEPDRRPLAAE